MLAVASFAFGILLAIIVLAVTRREPEVSGPAPPSRYLGWYTLVFGLAAVTAFVIGLWVRASGNLSGMADWLLNLSIALAFAAVWVGVGALRRRERHWPTWAGFVAGLAPAIFWIAYAAGNFLGYLDVLS
jgi:hypothetical protein